MMTGERRCGRVDKRIVIVTHGGFSEGILSSLRMVAGDIGPIECITAYVDKDVDYQVEFRRIVSEHDYSKAELLVLTDVLGGSVNNEFMQLLAEYPFHLVTGINFALLLEIGMCPAEELVESLPRIVSAAREHIVLCDTLLVEGDEEDEGNSF